MTQGYFLMVDILGFGKIVQNLPNKTLTEKIDSWVSIVQRICSEHSVSQYQLISDTLFIGAGHNDSDLLKIIKISSSLLNICIPKSIPLRGSISFGDYTWSTELVYGKAVIEAHTHEMAQDWIGISCASSVPLSEKSESWQNMTCYPVPMKNGPLQFLPAVNWNVPDYDELLDLLTRGGLTKNDEKLSHPWLNRAEKTVMFSMYRDIASMTKIPPHKFGGFGALHSIHEYFKENFK
ncbi:MAG: hypothetical protein WC836_23160 [Desulfobacula sp.]|jgi:hypothetical protein